MAKVSIRINTELHFDGDTEEDLIKLVQSYAREKKLNRFLESAIRVISSMEDGRKLLNDGVKGNAIDRERRAFFENQKKQQEQREQGMMELSVEMAEYQMKIDTAVQRVQEELAKLYVLANSGKLLGLKERANMLNTENLLIAAASRRYQETVWQHCGRPKASVEEEQKNRSNLESLSKEVIEFLSERYTENLSELRSLFVTEAEPQGNGQLLEVMMQMIQQMQSKPMVQTQQVNEQVAQPMRAQAPIVQRQEQVVQEQEPVTNEVKEPTQENFDQVLDMFGSCFDI